MIDALIGAALVLFFGAFCAFMGYLWGCIKTELQISTHVARLMGAKDE